jgi:hypothetical protein
MICSSTSLGASIPEFCCTAIEARPGSAAEILSVRQSSDGQVQTNPVAIGAATGLFIIAVLLAVMTAASASADPSRPRNVGPDEADLRHYFDCSKVATMRLLSLDEATGCARVFMRIKLSFVPGVGLNDFDRLPLQEKAAVNLVGYRRYVEWLSENSGEVEDLRNAPLSSSTLAEN